MYRNKEVKILTVLGARPQFIKASMVSKALAAKGLEEIIVHTGQHFDRNMSDIFFEEMEVPVPKYNLNIHSLSHGAMTGQMLEKIEQTCLAEKPDALMVYGDTNSTLAGALAAKKLHIKVVHVEAGLRSFNIQMPEEVNRILTDRISDVLFCPTDTAVSNLKKEGFDNFNCRIIKNGDVMQDASLHYQILADKRSTILQDLGIEKNNYLVATIHRAENTDDLRRLNAIISSLNEINNTIPVIIPIHPRTRKIIENQGIKTSFKMIDPVGYLDMISLVSNSRIIMTDSGGLQKEAYFFNKYCITLRDETEWTELLDNGFNTLAGASAEKIISSFNQLKDQLFKKGIELYGAGKASAILAETLANG